MLDPLYIKLGSFFHILGNFGLIIACFIVAIIILLVVLYNKTDLLSGINGYRFLKSCKKWLIIAIIIACIGIVFHVLGIFITPDPNNSIEQQLD